MRCNFIVLITSLLFTLSVNAIDLQSNSSLKYKKVIDMQTGTIDNEFCSRDCPKYPGGEEALVKHVYNQLGLSPDAPKSQNATVVKFLVTSSGKIRDVSIEKTSNEQFDKEILKAIQSLPNYFPSKEQNVCYYGWFSIFLPQ